MKNIKNQEKKQNEEIRVGNVPFEKIVGGLLKVAPKNKKSKKNNNKQS